VSDLSTRTSPRQARSKRSLDLILDAAERLFHTKGVTSTTTVDIADAAGISVGRLYYWFPDKDAIVHSVMSRAETQCRAFITAHVIDHPGDHHADMIASQVVSFAEFFRRHPGALAVVSHYGTDEQSPGHALRQMWVEECVRLFGQRIPRAAERPDVAFVVAQTCVGIAIGMFTEYVRYDPEVGDLLLRELRNLLEIYVAGRFDERFDEP
jgi:AcrR family transcriptional regulator